jgi:hypothetical protein
MFKYVNHLVYKFTLVSMALGLAPQMASAGALGALHSIASHASKASAGASLAKRGAAGKVASALTSHKPNVSQFAHSATSAIGQHAGNLNRQSIVSKLGQVSNTAQTGLGNKLANGSPSGVARLLQAANNQNIGNTLGQQSHGGLSHLLQAVNAQTQGGAAAGAAGNVANAMGNAANAMGNAAGNVMGNVANAMGNAAANMGAATQTMPPIINIDIPSLGGGGVGGFGPFGGRFGGFGGGYNSGYYSNYSQPMPVSTMVADATPTTTPATTVAQTASDVTPVSYTTPVNTTTANTIPTVANDTSPSNGTPDLVVEDIHLAEPATLLAGPAYRVKFRNQGMGSTGPFRVGLFAVLDNAMTGSQAVVDVAGLAAGQMAEVTLRLPQSALQTVAANGQSTTFNRLAVSIDSDGTVNETDRSNNAAIVDRAAVEAAH